MEQTDSNLQGRDGSQPIVPPLSISSDYEKSKGIENAPTTRIRKRKKIKTEELGSRRDDGSTVIQEGIEPMLPVDEKQNEILQKVTGGDVTTDDKSQNLDVAIIESIKENVLADESVVETSENALQAATENTIQHVSTDADGLSAKEILKVETPTQQINYEGKTLQELEDMEKEFSAIIEEMEGYYDDYCRRRGGREVVKGDKHVTYVYDKIREADRKLKVHLLKIDALFGYNNGYIRDFIPIVDKEKQFIKNSDVIHAIQNGDYRLDISELKRQKIPIHDEILSIISGFDDIDDDTYRIIQEHSDKIFSNYNNAVSESLEKIVNLFENANISSKRGLKDPVIKYEGYVSILDKLKECCFIMNNIKLEQFNTVELVGEDIFNNERYLKLYNAFILQKIGDLKKELEGKILEFGEFRNEFIKDAKGENDKIATEIETRMYNLLEYFRGAWDVNSKNRESPIVEFITYDAKDSTTENNCIKHVVNGRSFIHKQYKVKFTKEGLALHDYFFNGEINKDEIVSLKQELIDKVKTTMEPKIREAERDKNIYNGNIGGVIDEKRASKLKEIGLVHIRQVEKEVIKIREQMERLISEEKNQGSYQNNSQTSNIKRTFVNRGDGESFATALKNQQSVSGDSSRKIGIPE
ncbi:MAG: hypothetical protein LBC92_01900 [Rickettsiales bacterium]|nr:hypothetical protein [Rickettsiales bacterium]